MRNRSTKTAHECKRVCTLHRCAIIVLLVSAFCSVAAAQRNDAIRERGPHTLYGDIKIEAEKGDESPKPLSLEV